MNNFEEFKQKIAKMDINKMSKFLDEFLICSMCIYFVKENCTKSKRCKTGIEQWLQSEAEEG